MPVIKRTAVKPPDEQSLIDELAGELRSPREKGQPLILQFPIGDTADFNVYVVWDRWASVSEVYRNDMIYKAYFQFDRSLPAKIPTATGLTTAQAIVDGLLPIRIEPFPPGDGQFTAETFREALIEEGAIEVAGRLQLRFPTLDDGQETYGRLQARFPGGFRFIEELPALID